jgi:hypothetical protein
MECIIDMTFLEEKPTLQDFKIFNRGGPDIENQLAAVKEYQDATQSTSPRPPLSPIIEIFSRINVFSFLPILSNKS